MRVSVLVATAALGFAALAPAAIPVEASAAGCPQSFDLWIRLAKPSVTSPGATVVIPMTWGLKPVPPAGYDNGTIVQNQRWRVTVGSGATIKAAFEKDPPSSNPYQYSTPAHIAGSTATFELQLGSSPLTLRAAYITVRLAPTVTPGSRVRIRASIDTYNPYTGGPGLCYSEYRPSDNSSTQYVTAAGHPKPPTHSASATPTPTTPSRSTASSPSDVPSPSPTPSATPSETALALPLPTPAPASPGPGALPIALAVAGSGGVGAAVLGGAVALRRRRRPHTDRP